MKKALLFIVMITIMIGCASVRYNTGKEFDETKMALIKKNVTTKNDILELFGEPISKTITNDGLETWTYQHVLTTSNATVIIIYVQTSGSSQLKNLTIKFTNNIVTDYQYTTSITELGSRNN